MVPGIPLLYNLAGLWLVLLIGAISGTRVLLPHRLSVVVCPESKLPAAVDVDGQLAIEACSRRPNVQECNHGCRAQLCFSSEELETFLAKSKRSG